MFLLSLLGSRGGIVVVLGWLALGGFDTTLNGGDVVARWMWVVIGWCVKFVSNIVGVVGLGTSLCPLLYSAFFHLQRLFDPHSSC